MTSSRSRAALLPALLAGFALLFSGITLAPAEAAGILAQPISGTVTAGGQPVSGATVDVLDGNQTVVETGTTGADGTYSIPADSGTYRVRFTAAGYQTEFYNRKFSFATAEPITLFLSGRSGVDASLSRPPAVSGTVTGGGTPVAGAEVVAYTGATVAKRTTTDSKGAYSLSVPIGSYTLYFGGDTRRKGEFFENAATAGAATPVAVGIDGRKVDADLALNPYVAGTVVDAAGAPVEGAHVDVTGIGIDVAATDTTDVTGAFRVRLPAGRYAVKVAADGFATEYYDDAPTAELATPVVLGSANVTLPRTIALSADKAIRGTVEDAAGKPLAGAVVRAFGREGDDFTRDAGAVETAADGTYVLSLAPGEYRLKIAADAHVTEFFDDASTLAAAKTLTLTRAADVTADVVLASLPTNLSGTVTGADAKPLAGATIAAERKVVEGETTTWVDAGERTTNASGAYTFTGLADGSYRLRFSHEGNVPEYFDDAATAGAATPVTVAAGTPAVANAQLATTVGGVSGTVNGDAGPLAGIEVAVLDADGTTVATATTDAAGQYKATVNPGSYRVRFSSADGQFVEEYFDNASTLAGATAVTVGSTVVTGINALLEQRRPLAGTISGNGGPIYGATAALHDLTDDHVVATSTTGIDGRYTLYAAPGQYRLEVWGGNYFKGKTQTVTLGANGLVLDVELQRYQVVVGGVTDAAGKAVVGAEVRSSVLKDGAWVTAAFTRTGSAGEYFLPVSPGTYRVQFDGHDVGLGSIFYKQAATAAAATNVTVAATGDVLGIDAALPAATGVKATVTRTGPAAGQADGVRLDFYRYDATDDRWVHAAQEDATVDAAGTGAALVALDPGTYRVKVRDVTYGESEDVLGAARYYDGAATFAAAKSVVVTSGTATPIAVGYGRLPSLTTTVAPSVSGSPLVGELLTAAPGTWSPEGATFTYQWLRNGAAITGATATTYRLVAADLGTSVSVRVTASKTGFSPTSATSAGQTVQPAPLKNTALPRITGTAALGKTLLVSSGTWSPSGATYTYQWRRDGVSIDGATRVRYTTTTADLGHKLSVKVTASKPGSTSAAVFSPQTAVIKSTASISVRTSASGSGKVTFAITVSSAGISPTGVVQVRRGSALLKVARVSGNKATVTLTGQPKGARVYTVVYMGTTKTSTAKVNLPVQVR